MSSSNDRGSQPDGEHGLSNKTDLSLLRRFRRGNDDAATALYVRYAERLQRLADNQVSNDLASRVDADEIVQSVFRTFFRRAADGQYDIAGQEDLWKLLLVMALNKVRSTGTWHRAEKRSASKTRSLDAVDPLPSGQKDTSESVAFLVLKMTVNEVLGELAEEHQDVVRLRIEGFEVDDIVERTGRAKRSIERILQGFRKKLLTVIGEPS